MGEIKRSDTGGRKRGCGWGRREMDGRKKVKEENKTTRKSKNS